MTKHFTGGYFIHGTDLVRSTGAYKHTAADLSQISSTVINSVNLIQKTPWRVNGFIFDVVDHYLNKGMNLKAPSDKESPTSTLDHLSEGDVVLRCFEPIDPQIFDKRLEPIPSELWKGMDKEAQRREKQKRSGIRTLYESRLGEYRATVRVIQCAEEMLNFEKFYFPHNLDFRLRTYPIPNDLHPQSSDLAQGLLEFAVPTRLGEEGLYWLAGTVASHWGEDKLHPDARANYAEEEWFMDMCKKVVENPLVNLEWTAADKPFQFLACAYEWVMANSLENPEEFLSRGAGPQDGSCNGAQHLSIISRDQVGAKATNCTSLNERQDLYMEVADRVFDKVREDMADGNEWAVFWYKEMTEPSARRKLVKRSVMTVPYGVTERGIADFMIKDGHVSREEEEYWEKAKYIRDLIWESIGSTLKQGQALQRYFSECAALCAEAGVPLAWDTPDGSKVTQAYRNVIMKRVQAFSTKFYVYQEPEDTEDEVEFHERIGMDKGKMITAAPPNVIHSCDGSHLHITVERCGAMGITNFAMIHDSFGVPYAQVGILSKVLRRAAVDMYEGNYLKTWKESVERYSGLQMPEPPELGTFDIQEILESVFFFS